MHILIIFVTGLIILALQLLASRMMTPFFGVSLYIWAGILSTTLLCLAIGYIWGGKLAQRTHSGRQNERLRYLYLMLPAVSACYIAALAFFYEKIFAAASGAGLFLGSLVSCVAFLAVPLIAMSALNPLLMAILVNYPR
jgi:hypothetical protein